jgi:O-antigen ligase
MFIANFRYFKNGIGLILVIIALTGGAILVKNGDIMLRFKDMLSTPAMSVNNTERFNYWEQGFEVFKDHPIFGIGPSVMPNLPPEKNINRRKATYSHAHSIYLTFLAETGLVGLAAFLFFITRPVYLLRSFWRSQDRLIFFWTWTAFMVMLHLFMHGVIDYVFNNKMIMLLHFSVLGTALWVALGRWTGDANIAKPSVPSVQNSSPQEAC